MGKFKDYKEYRAALLTTLLMLVTMLMTITQHPNTFIRMYVGGGSLLALLVLIILVNRGYLEVQYKYITSIIFYIVALFYVGTTSDVGYVNALNIFIGVAVFSLYNNHNLTKMNSVIGCITLNISYFMYKDTMFASVNSSEMTTLNMFYIFLCGCIIAANVISHKLTMEAENAALEATQKNKKIEDLLAQIEASTKNLTHISSGVKDNIEGIDQSSSYITESVSIFTERIMNENESVLSASESVEEIYNNIENVMNISKEMISHSNDSQKAVNDGISKINELFDSMDNVKTVVGSTKELMDELTKQMNNVHSIVGTIGSISEQTNMLSLNAAIESARAGEHGRGFAVVSNNIRSLAAESKIATNNISNIIVKLYETINLVVQKVEQGEESVVQAEGSKKVVETVLEEMHNTLGKTLDKTRLVQGEINNLNKLSKGIKDNIHEISDSAQNNAALIQDIMAKIEEENASITYVTKDINDLDDLTLELSSSLK